MAVIDHYFNWDWTNAAYLGDGIYMMRLNGDIALRTDRDNHPGPRETSHIIVLEPHMLDDLKKWANKTAGEMGEDRGPFTVIDVTPGAPCS